MKRTNACLPVILISAAILFPAPAPATERTHFIAIEEVDWDYAPLGLDNMTGGPFGEEARAYVERSADRIGRVYRKALYREYTDATFTTPRPRPEAWAHLGTLGPVIHAEVGDTIRVVLKNNASHPYSLHAHGVFYGKDSEGTPYDDGTSGAEKADDAVAPGGTHAYVWHVPARAGPGPGDPSSLAWLYHSHTDEPRDTNSGLVGAIIVTGAGLADPNGAPKDVDREFVTLFTVFDENASWYLDRNIARFADSDAVDPEAEAFIESNLMHTINGYVFGNLPGLVMKRCERVRWYVMALGTEVDLHTPHWHGNTGLMGGRRVDVVNLLPGSTEVVDMRPDNPGVWMYHCHVNDHIGGGMTALYVVKEYGAGDC